MPQHCSAGKCEQHLRSHILPHCVLPYIRRQSHIQPGTSTVWTVNDTMTMRGLKMVAGKPHN